LGEDLKHRGTRGRSWHFFYPRRRSLKCPLNDAETRRKIVGDCDEQQRETKFPRKYSLSIYNRGTNSLSLSLSLKHMNTDKNNNIIYYMKRSPLSKRSQYSSHARGTVPQLSFESSRKQSSKLDQPCARPKRSNHTT